MRYQEEEISLRPLRKDIQGYSWQTLRYDLLAGLAVSMLSIPQALAYAAVIGLPPYCGLMSTIFGTAICALLGASRHLVIGPNNTTVLLVQSATATILYKYYPGVAEGVKGEISLQIMATLLLLIGLMQLLSGVCKLGRAIQFASVPVIIGYVLGSAFAISAEQLYAFLGIESTGEQITLFEKMRYLVMHVQELHIPTAIIGVFSLVVLMILRKMRLQVPVALIMILIVTPLVYMCHLHNVQDDTGRVLSIIGDSGAIEAVIPSLQLPLFDLKLFNAFLPIAFAIAAISMLETISITKSITERSGQRVHVNQELFGLGAANLFLSFFGSLPASGSISRTQVNFDSKGRTRFAAVFSALFVAVAASYFGSLIQYIPICVLAALIMATAMRMVDGKQLRLCLRTTHSDAFVLITTFLCCIFFSLHIAFYIGVFLSIVLYLRKAAMPEVVEYSYDRETEELRPMLASEKSLKKKIRIINIEGDLFFGAVDIFQSALKTIAEDDDATKVFIIRLKHVRDMDATAVSALKHLDDYLRKNHKSLIVTSIPLQVWQVLENSKLLDYIGRDNLFLYDEQNPHRSTQLALERAWQLA